jgi:sterol desaturase/sphingolipid hydroxylase (fatty acid hydroxylase superfamily)
VHRWVMHGRHTANPITAEHLDHHRHLERTDPLRFDRFLLWPAAGGLAVGSAAAAVAPAPVAAAAGTAFAASYCGYRHLHWAIHHRAPRTRWGRYLRRHHLRHHVGSPRGNHGVTSPVWDLLLGTRRPDIAPVTLPAAMAPPWLGHPGNDRNGRSGARVHADYLVR